jgi:hypothetical protein
LDRQAIKDIAPILIGFVDRQVVRRETMASALPNGNWITQISGGLSIAEIQEYLRIWDFVQGIQLNEAPDTLIWRWTADGTYTSRSTYKALHIAPLPMPGCKRIWCTWAPLRVKIFLWLALRRRHWMADRLQRHGLPTAVNCFLCDQQPETNDNIHYK